MDETIQKNLMGALSLSAYEAKLYMAGLNSERATLSELAKGANMPRTAAYPPLQSLLKRGLISATQIKKRRYYRSVKPEQLKYVLEQNRLSLQHVIDELNQEINAPQGNFSVQYFTGVDGIYMAGEIFLNEAKGELWKTFEHPELVLKKLSERYSEEFNRRRVEKKIYGRVIMHAPKDSSWVKKHLERNKEELREVILVSPEQYPLQSSMGIADNMVFLYTVVGNPFAIIIENKPIAQSWASIHDMTWDRYRK